MTVTRMMSVSVTSSTKFPLVAFRHRLFLVFMWRVCIYHECIHCRKHRGLGETAVPAVPGEPFPQLDPLG